MQLYLRYGSHSEKDYFEKMLRFFDGVVFASNLLESTPSATVSLIAKFSGAKQTTNYYIDPMTYSFGEFFDYSTGEIWTDLDWIKSKTKKGYSIKSSYKKLGKALGGNFNSAIEAGKAISVENLKDPEFRKSICSSTINYQRNRVPEILRKDKEFAHYADDLPAPRFILAPYFFIQPGRENEWLEVTKEVIKDSLELEADRLYLKLCFDKSLLLEDEFTSKIADICDSDIKGVWLWVNDFNEKTIDENYLHEFKRLVEVISSKGKEVYNRHGGFFSLLLTKWGLSGVSHGVGYGEQKDIMPVLGGGTPTVNYYFPVLHKKYGIPDIERSFVDIKVMDAATFHEKICSCAICKGVLSGELKNFRQYGETHYATETSKRVSQTPAAAKRARFHYLLARLNEKKRLEGLDSSGAISLLKESLSVSRLDYFSYTSKFITTWVSVLEKK